MLPVLQRVARRSASRARVLQLLSPLAVVGGPALSPAELRDEISVLLDGDAPLEPLVDAAVRVLAPLQALGGSFDDVIVCSAVDDRLPTAPREDPLLSDRLLARLQFPDSTIHGAKERLRFAAAVSAARQRLIVSVPAQRFDEDRPLAPSRLLADLLTAAGCPAGLAALRDALARVGSRAHPWRDDVGAPLGNEARAHRARGRALAALPETARAVLALERALRIGSVETLPDDFAPPTTLSPEELLELIDEPLTFSFGRVLGGRPAARLDAGGSLLEPRGLRAAVRSALDETTLASPAAA